VEISLVGGIFSDLIFVLRENWCFHFMYIFKDDGPGSLKGGRLGVYCDSQEQIIYSALAYRCKSEVSEEIYRELPSALQQRVTIQE